MSMTSSRALAPAMDERDQGGGPALRGQVRQLGGPGVLGVAGQASHPPGRQAGQVKFTDPEGHLIGGASVA